MSFNNFGELGKLLTKINKKINEQEEKSFSVEDYYKTLKEINKKVKIDFITFKNLFDRFFHCKYELKKLTFEDGTNGFRELDNRFEIDEIKNKIIKVPEKYKKKEEHFQKLFNIPQPAQRTQGWFDYRNARITASDTAAAIDKNPYEPIESFISKKCDPNFPFRDNIYVCHGKKFEQIATLYYEHLYNNKVTEFGCLPSEKYKFLGASPDGICSKSTLDGQFSDRLGVMLEIKCPFSRKIINKGDTIGTICPFYYYCQVQQQLECCDLDQCDFWQCKIDEYKSREDYLKDVDFKPIITEGNLGEKITFNVNTAKGCLLQFLPKEYIPLFDEDKHEFKAKFVYPPRLDMNINQYNEWIIEQIGLWSDDKYYFDKVIYWKIPFSHNVTINRDKKWFAQIFPVLEESWRKIVYYRKNPDELYKINKIAEKRTKFYFKTDYTIADFKVENKILFLDNNVSENKEDCVIESDVLFFL
jgi:putative phage-type endonuclease